MLPDSDSEDDLPPAWEERATNDGFVYYVNHQTKSTQWTHPRTSKLKRVNGELPFGWEKKVEEETGKILFVDHQNKVLTYTDPRLAFAVEEVPQNIGEVRQRFDSTSTSLQVLHGRDLSGKIAICTGANSGIGFETSKSLAFHGCQVIMACRSEEKTNMAIEKIHSEKPAAGKKCIYMNLDLASLESTRNFVDEIKKKYKHIDILILNAGVFGLPYTTTIDNFETTFQVNHLSHFYLTISLGELLNESSRVVILSSESHRFSNIPIHLSEQILSPPIQKYYSMTAYNNAKLCNLLFAYELSKRWKSKGISIFSLHPGNLVSSNLSRNWWLYRLFFAIVRPFTKSLQQASSTTVYCSTANELTGLTGLYFNNCYFCEPSELSKNDTLSEELWNISEDMIKRTFNKTTDENLTEKNGNSD